MSDLIVPATEANRSFSKLLRAAREGARITITSHGEPVAELIPVDKHGAVAAERAQREKALRELMDHLRTVKPKVIGPWTREELYDRD